MTKMMYYSFKTLDVLKLRKRVYETLDCSKLKYTTLNKNTIIRISIQINMNPPATVFCVQVAKLIFGLRIIFYSKKFK